LVEGHTLAQELVERGVSGLPEVTVLGWACQLGDALAYLHGQVPPIVFRDLKPQNIMLRPGGQVVLIDFGIARPAVSTGGTTIGTPGYAPPEQYQGLAEPRSDQYALAATMHHLLTGRDPEQAPPFAFPSLDKLVAGLHGAVVAALARALAMPLEDRFSSIEEFIAAFMSDSDPAPAHLAGVRATRITSPASAQSSALPSTAVHGTGNPVESSDPSGIATSFGNGTWRVGVDIAPGTYRTDGGDGYCQILRNFTGTGNNIIAHESVRGGPCVITIGPKAVGVKSVNCKIWTRL